MKKTGLNKGMKKINVDKSTFSFIKYFLPNTFIEGLNTVIDESDTVVISYAGNNVLSNETQIKKVREEIDKHLESSRDKKDENFLTIELD